MGFNQDDIQMLRKIIREELEKFFEGEHEPKEGNKEKWEENINESLQKKVLI